MIDRTATLPYAQASDQFEAEVAELERTYHSKANPLWAWVTSVDHKSIGKRYIATCFAFFLLAGLNAAVMRMQLARPENHIVGPDRYNQGLRGRDPQHPVTLSGDRPPSAAAAGRGRRTCSTGRVAA